MDSENSGPYTTITVKEYTHMQEVLLGLRRKLQEVRQFLEQGDWDKALALVRSNEDQEA